MDSQVKVSFIAGFGPVVDDYTTSRELYSQILGIQFDELEGGYLHTRKLPGCKGFGLWPLSQAAEDCFGKKIWPEDIPKPQAWLEFDVEDLKAASEELKKKGYRLLLDSFEEPYGQTVTRFLSPEGILIGLTVTPWLRDTEEEEK